MVKEAHECQVPEGHPMAGPTKHVDTWSVSSGLWSGLETRTRGAAAVRAADESVENEKRQNEAWTGKERHLKA